VQSLRKTPIFSDLSDAELAFLTRHAVVQHYDAGQLIFSAGDPCRGLYVVESGQLKIFKISANGREQVLSLERPGSSVAELPVFDGGNYPASAAALTAATLLFLRKEDFYSLCLEHPEVALKVLRAVGSRLRRLVDIIEELSFSTVRHRLAALLVRMAE